MSLLRRTSLLLTLIALLPALAVAQSAELDRYISRAVRDWGVPGVAVAIVKDDKVILAKGYGLKSVDAKEQVDSKTIFGIASNTKAFAAASIALLVDAGKLRWDDRVVDHLPQFRMADPYVTRELRIRDLLAHRNGLPPYGGDIMTWGSSYTREEILDRIRHVSPVTSFRSEYAYQNGMFITAGEVVEAVTGKSWDEFVREHFFVPLRMHSTSTTISSFVPQSNIAQPHIFVNGKHERIPWRDIGNLGAAAAINSNVEDLARWVRLQLGQGVFEGKRIYSADAAHEMWMPQTAMRLPISSRQSPPAAKWSAYGLGWTLRDYHGRRIVRHGGWTDGMLSTVAMLPEESLGVVVLTNSHNRNITSAIVYSVFDAYLGLKSQDWSAVFLARARKAEAAAEEAQRELEARRVKGSKPSRALESYTGTYRNELYGDVVVSLANGRLAIDFTASPTFKGELEHWHFDTFRSKWRERIPDAGAVVFTLDESGRVRDLTTTLGDFIEPQVYTFTKVEK